MAAKKDVLHDFLKILDFNRWTWLLPIIGVLVLSGCLWAMAARVPSLNDPTINVRVDVFNVQAADAQAQLDKRAAELKVDQQALDAKVQAAADIVKKHDENIAAILQFTGGAITQVASGQPVNPLALGTSLIGLMGGLAAGGATVLDPKRRTSLKKQIATS